jgi:protein-S-isoprenylcysteine O-methyltransferase Ste14
MSTAVLTLLLINLMYVGLLPRFFFRADGRLNLKWWLTAAPFFLSTLFVILRYLDIAPQWYVWLPKSFADIAGTLLSSASIALISYTLGTHRRRLSLWHQTNDAPEEIVTYGAYRRIRHPFYAAFILVLIATLVVAPAPWCAAVLGYGVLMLNYTAAREERNLQSSQFGMQYRSYLQTSGRFFPKLWGAVQ